MKTILNLLSTVLIDTINKYLTLLEKNDNIYEDSERIEMFEELEMDFLSVKKNLNRQATKILHDIANAYTQGVLDDPEKAQVYCNMLACICEGKVEGILDEDTMEVKWSLTAKYQEYIEELRAAIVSDNVVKGPW